MKLNYRDKVILGVLLAIIILAAAGFGLVKPKIKEIKDNKARLQQLEEQKAEIERKIAEIGPLKTEIMDLYDESTTLTKEFVDYNSIYTARKVDQYLQHFAVENEVKIKNLTTSDLATGTLGYYYLTRTFPGEDLLAQADLNGDRRKDLDEEKAEQNALSGRTAENVLRAQYSVTIEGEKEKIFDYLKAFETQKETIIINSVSLNNIEIKEKKGNKKPEDEDVKPQATIVISLYSVYELSEPNVEMN